MNLNKVEKEFQKVFSKFKYQTNHIKDYIQFRIDKMTFEGIDDDISCEVVAFERDMGAIEFILDKVTNPEMAYELINKYNDTSLFIKCLINTNGYLTFRHSVVKVTSEKDFVNLVSIIFGELGKNYVMPILVELSKLTK